MKTIIKLATDPETLPYALEILQAGGLVALPTDTVYGLGAMAFNRAAVKKIYKVKGRGNDKAIPILVGDPNDLNMIGLEVPEMALKLAGRFWPGPLTLLIPKNPAIPDEVSRTSSIAVRIPDQTLTRNLLRLSGPMAVTSANLSGRTSPTTAGEVLAGLDGRIELIIDAGPVIHGLASTIVDCLGSIPVILREGPISMEEILSALDS
jgi:L-threonylcarbamoyladenylate synthase